MKWSKATAHREECGQNRDGERAGKKGGLPEDQPQNENYEERSCGFGGGPEGGKGGAEVEEGSRRREQLGRERQSWVESDVEVGMWGLDIREA